MDTDGYRLHDGVYASSVLSGAATPTASQRRAPIRTKDAGHGVRTEATATATGVGHAGDTRQPALQLSNHACLPSLRGGLLYLSLLVPAYARAQSFVGGDLSRQAPYGLPAQDFAVAISNPTTDTTFAIQGYNTSFPAGTSDAIGTTVGGWTLNIGVTANVPLANSAYDSVDKDLCTDATTLSVTPPAGVAGFNSSAWRVCAVVFTDGLKAANDVAKDGSCSSALPEGCIRQLQANSVAAGAGRNGGCRDLDVPANCKGRFIGNGGTAFEITPIGNNTTAATAAGDRRSPFFAAGFEPRHNNNNQSALSAVERRVWPVLLAWTHFTEDGEVQDGAGWLSCARATDSKALTSDEPSHQDIVEALMWALVFWLGYLVVRYGQSIIDWIDNFMLLMVHNIGDMDEWLGD